MSTVLEYPATELADTDFHAFNLAVWEKLTADPALASLDFRIETDRHGQIIMSPPPAPSHGNKQVKIGSLLSSLLKGGEVISECPVSTRLGVKAVDVAWCSSAKWQGLAGQACFTECPEICVEILSPSNTRGEIEEKKNLYFEAGALEVWICRQNGEVSFFDSQAGNAMSRSKLAGDFPDIVS